MCVLHFGDRVLCVYPLDETISLLGHKWAVLILGVLANKPGIRFQELEAALPGIGQRVLTDRLQELERRGLIHREMHREVPPRTEYRLMPESESLWKALVPVLEWAVERAGKS